MKKFNASAAEKNKKTPQITGNYGNLSNKEAEELETLLSEERTAMAEERTILSKERTLLAQAGIFLGVIALGFGLIRVYEDSGYSFIVYIGCLIVLLSLIPLFIIAKRYTEYEKLISKIEREERLKKKAIKALLSKGKHA
ncbi:MAG: hypothetical protein QXP42_01450 [Candidatus Micrarchaeia archaeon]